MRSDMVPGASFPDYELSDQTGQRRKLSTLQGQHPMVLVLSRGGFCPKDGRQAEGLVQLHQLVHKLFRSLVVDVIVPRSVNDKQVSLKAGRVSNW